MLVFLGSKPLENSGKNSKYNFIGWIGAFALFILLSFYSVIGGWILVYLGIEFGKLFQLGGTGDYAQLFTSIISNPAIALGAQAAFILVEYLYCITWGSKGIERASKVMMPCSLSSLSSSSDALSVCQMPWKAFFTSSNQTSQN